MTPRWRRCKWYLEIARFKLDTRGRPRLYLLRVRKSPPNYGVNPPRAFGPSYGEGEFIRKLQHHARISKPIAPGQPGETSVLNHGIGLALDGSLREDLPGRLSNTGMPNVYRNALKLKCLIATMEVAR